MDTILFEHKHAIVLTRTIPPGTHTVFQNTPCHKILVCLSGEGIAARGIDNIVLRPGTSVLLLPQDLHRLHNTGDKQLVMVEFAYGLPY